MFKIYYMCNLLFKIILKSVYNLTFSLKMVSLRFEQSVNKSYISGIIGRLLFECSTCSPCSPVNSQGCSPKVLYVGYVDYGYFNHGYNIMDTWINNTYFIVDPLGVYPVIVSSNTFAYVDNESLIIYEYFTILIYLFLAIILSYVIIGFSYIFVVQNPETEKMSAYECGFEPYEDARQKFDVKFYIIAMLFIIFDIETMYLIPWCVALPFINSVGYFVMMEFILELCVGFLYVWYVGGLDWD